MRDKLLFIALMGQGVPETGNNGYSETGYLATEIPYAARAGDLNFKL